MQHVGLGEMNVQRRVYAVVPLLVGALTKDVGAHTSNACMYLQKYEENLKHFNAWKTFCMCKEDK